MPWFELTLCDHQARIFFTDFHKKLLELNVFAKFTWLTLRARTL